MKKIFLLLCLFVVLLGSKSFATAQELSYKQRVEMVNELIEAAKVGNIAILEKNKAYINDINYDNYTPIAALAEQGNLKAVQALLDLGAKVDETNEGLDETPLMLAAGKGHSEVARLLIQYGADVNCISYRGYTALMAASCNGHINTMHVLVENGADVNLHKPVLEPCEAWYGTALMSASRFGQVEAVKFLLANNANVYIEYPIGDHETALDFAKDAGHEGVVRALKNAINPSTAEIKNYDFSTTSEIFQNIEVPDFLDFSTGKATPAANVQADEHRQNAYGLTYYGSYYGNLERYVRFLETQGFAALVRGYEGFYLLEKKEGTHFLQIYTYFLNETEGVQVDILLTQQSSKLSHEQVESEISRIRKIYNEIVHTDYTKTQVDARETGGIIVYSDKDEHVHRIDIPKKRGAEYARFYYFENGVPLFAFFDGKDSHRMYFYKGALLRDRYTDAQGVAVNYNYSNAEKHINLSEQMKGETGLILQEFYNR